MHGFFFVDEFVSIAGSDSKSEKTCRERRAQREDAVVPNNANNKVKRLKPKHGAPSPRRKSFVKKNLTNYKKS